MTTEPVSLTGPNEKEVWPCALKLRPLEKKTSWAFFKCLFLHCVLAFFSLLGHAETPLLLFLSDPIFCLEFLFHFTRPSPFSIILLFCTLGYFFAQWPKRCLISMWVLESIQQVAVPWVSCSDAIPVFLAALHPSISIRGHTLACKRVRMTSLEGSSKTYTCWLKNLRLFTTWVRLVVRHFLQQSLPFRPVLLAENSSAEALAHWASFLSLSS